MKDCDICCRQETRCPKVAGGSDVWVGNNDCNIRLDIKAESIRNTVIWGYVRGWEDCPLEGVLLTLFHYRNSRGLECIGHTRTETNGYYQFELPADCRGRFRVETDGCVCASDKTEANSKQNNIGYY